YTANPGASAYNHYKYFSNLKDRYASAHIFVDKTEAYLIIPLDEVAYAANDGTYRGVPELKPNANYRSVSVELCIEKDGSFHPETIKRAAQINAELCSVFNLDPIKDIVRHYDVTHKNCPAPWVKSPDLFDKFKQLVRADLVDKTLEKVEEKIIMELNQVQKEMVDRLKTLKITDGNDPEKPATQLYVWTLIDELRRVVYTDINKVKSE
ncbi:TPA: N-acetylmuramoyl-L-alanine amidase family protein, partial [Escherichia coli]